MNSGSMDYHFQPVIVPGSIPKFSKLRSNPRKRSGGTGYNVPLPIDPLAGDPQCKPLAMRGRRNWWECDTGCRFRSRVDFAKTSWRLDENIGMDSCMSGTNFGFGCSADRTTGKRSGSERTD